MSDIVELNSIVSANLVEVNGIAIADAVSINGAAVPSGYDWGSFTGDDFTGNDGDPPDTDVWEVITEESTDGWGISTNKLRMDCEATDNNVLDSKFVLTGDYDIEIDLDLITYPSTNFWIFYLYTKVSDSIWTESRFHYSSARQLTHKARNGGSTFDYTAVDYNGTSITIAQVRSGTNLSTYYDDGGGRTLIKTSSILGYSGQNAYVEFRTFSLTGNPAFVIDLDNFTINSGTAIAK